MKEDWSGKKQVYLFCVSISILSKAHDGRSLVVVVSEIEGRLWTVSILTCIPAAGMLTVGAVGLSSKLFLNLGCKEVTVIGLPILVDALEESRRTGRGLITGAWVSWPQEGLGQNHHSCTQLSFIVANHISV